MRMQLFLTAAVLLLAGTIPADAYDLFASGDHAVWVITRDVKASFEKKTGLSLDLVPELAISGKGCTKGILHARRGSPDRDIGLVCCMLDSGTISRYGLSVYRFADEPLAIIVNKRNPVNVLTLAQVRDIFSGKITNWKNVGGRNERIAVITRLHCRDFMPNWKDLLGAPEQFTGKSVDVKSQPEMARTVEAYPSAIGYLDMTSVREAQGEVKIIALDGHLPTSENMEQGRYPLFAPLAVVTHGPARGNVVTFVDFMQRSPEAREAMRPYGMRQVR